MTDDEESGSRTFDGSAASGGAGVNSERMMADDIVSEGLASLAVLCGQFETDAQLWQTRASADSIGQAHTELARIRNLLIVLDKPALAFVVKELMAVCDPNRGMDAGQARQASQALASAASQISVHARALQVNRGFDSALGLISTLNDCRACLDKPFVSDTFLLAIGIDLAGPRHIRPNDIEQANKGWSQERHIWKEIASSSHTALSHCLQAWHREINDETTGALIKQLEQFADGVEQHKYLQTLSHLFRSAAQTTIAVREGQISIGPALDLMFRQLVQHVSDYESVLVPEDLVPRDLLRNYLFYVAQAHSESDAAVQLRRYFRLDRVRNLSSLAEPVKTPTIGVVYHLVNAIRSSITVQTRPLSEWLDSYQSKELEMPPLATIRVRLHQLESILMLLGATEALQHLEALNVYLLSRTLPADINETMASRLAQLLLKIDTSLDQKARQSIAVGKQSDAEAICTDAVYIDMAVDVCLREARGELQAIAASLFSQINSDEFDSACAMKVNEQLMTLSCSLQILPLPGFGELLSRLTASLATLATLDYNGADSAADQDSETISISLVTDLLAGIFSSTDDFLSSVLWPQFEDGEFLSAAEHYLKQLQLVLSSDDHDKQTSEPAAFSEAIEDRVQLSSLLPQRNLKLDDFNVSEVGSLTLSFDEDLLKLPETYDVNSRASISQEILFFSESADLLDNLEQAVAHALTPSANQRMQLPSLVMLKSLFSLTELAQSVGATEVLAIAQPLQRAALALHREGHQFDASQTRFVGKLVRAMRVRIQVFNSDRIVDTATTSVEEELPGFVGAIKKRTHAIKAKPEALLALSTEELTLDEVFDKEATEIVERVSELLANPVFGQEILNEILACVHTLKGSARMAGKTAIHESAHLLESGVQAGRSIDDKKEALAQGCRLLQGYLSQPSSRVDKHLNTDRLMSDMLDSTKHPAPANNQGDESLGQAKALSEAQRHLASALSNLDMPANDVKCATQRLCEATERGVVVSTSSLIPIVADLQASNAELRKLLEQSRSAHRQVVQTAARMQQSVLRDSFTSVDQMHDRLLPIVEDAADKCGVAVQFIFKSGDLLIGENVFRKLTTMLEHLVRNAIVHGIELPDERLSVHKVEKGTITLSIEFDNAYLVLRLCDDGRGVSVKAVNELLHKRGETPVNDLGELYRLLFKPGFTSLENATSIGGHGLGLSAVSNLMAQLDGEVEFEITELPGMTAVMKIPRRIIARRIVLIQNDNQLYGLPAANVISVSNRTAAREEAGDESDALSRAPRNVLFRDFLGVSGHLQVLDETCSFADMQPAAASSSVISSVVDPRPTVILDAEGAMITTVVDRVIGYRMLIIDPVDEPMAASGRFSAIGILETGERVLVLDIAKTLGKLESYSERGTDSASSSGAGFATTSTAGSGTNREADRAVPSVMLIDDSPVNRAKLADMMSARGLAVQFPGNATHAVDYINRHKPDLIVLDLDIPAFNAGSFLRQLRHKYVEAAPPIIATSRHLTVSARRAATRLGAAAFISKPCTDSQLYQALELAGISVADLNIG